MAITNFIPAVWSETLWRQLQRRCIGAANSWRAFEGDIKSRGDRVKINGIEPVNIFDYQRNSDFSAPQELSGNSRELLIDQAKAFNFQIDDIDAAQQHPKLMEFAMDEAARALAAAADDYIFGIWPSVGAGMTVTADGVTTSSVTDILLSAREKLSANNVSSREEIFLELSPAVATRVLKAKILTGTDNVDALDDGSIGSFLGMKVFVSTGVASAESGGKLYHKCFARTRRAIAFASQLASVEAYRPEKRFADAVKGLHLYGAKLVFPGEIVLLNLNLAATDG